MYISGPITGKPKANKVAFKDMEDRLIKCGAKVYNPRRHKIPAGTPSTEVWSVMMRKALLDLMNCEAIVMLNGWQGSRGARLERQIAYELAMELYNQELEKLN